MPSAPATSCTGHLVAQIGEAKLGFLRNRQLLKGQKGSGRELLQLDEDSTDIGSAMSSDAEMASSFNTPCCSDNEVAGIDRKSKNSTSCPVKQRRTTGVLGRNGTWRSNKASSECGNFQSTRLETIQGTPAGMSQHPPLFFTPPPAQAEAASDPMDMDGPSPQATIPKPDGFSAPPGLASPKRSRKAKSIGMQGPPGTFLATIVPVEKDVPSPRRSRKPKTLAANSLLATAPENSANESHVLPPSPSRRARLAILNKAKVDGAPLKVQMEAQNNVAETKFVKNLLDPTQPVKKKPILANFDQFSQQLKPGEPLKKHVTPWLLADPLGAFAAVPR